MRVSISITDFSWPGRLDTELERIVRAADEGGLDTVWLSDHLLQATPGSDPDSPMLEAYTTLGFLAARTQRVRLGTMVTAATFRPPALLIKQVTTLDVLSNGRAWLGIGAGYHEEEAKALGLPLPPLPQRFERLEETLQLALKMWAGETPGSSPVPATRPPVLIGGVGERRTLPLVARYADACNVFDIPDGGATVRHKLEVLERCCEEIGRPFGEISKTLSTRLAPGESFGALVERAEGLGIDHLVFITSGAWTVDAVQELGTTSTAH